MRAAVTTGSSIEVRDDVPDPTPGPGQVLVHTIVCGICGSDLHALAEPEEMAQLNTAGGATSVPPGTPYVLGHEFTAEIVGYGPATEGTLRLGSTVCALPYAMGPTGMEVIGFSPTLPGGYGELMVLQEAMLMPVPEGLAARTAALTEPPRAVIFEAVGRQGMIPNIIDAAPPGSRIVVAGVNTQGDRFVPAVAIVKELELRFGFGYAPSEFAATLARVARDPAAVAPLITSTVGVEGVTGALGARRAGKEIKVLIEH